MLGICFLLLSLFIWGGIARTPLDGGGYSLAYQSLGIGTDVASIANPLDCTQTYWPTTDLTVSFWLRCQQASPESYGIGCGTLFFMQQHTSTAYGSIFAPILSTNQQTMSASGFGDVTVSYPHSLPENGFFRWNHWVYNYRSATGNLTGYMNGERFVNIKFSSTNAAFKWCNNPGGEWSLTLGRNFFKPTGDVVEEASGRGFEGFWDEIGIWNRTLDISEIQQMYTTKLRGDEEGLLMYYDMNTPDPNVVKNMAFTGSRYDLLLGRTRGAMLYFDATQKANVLFTKPVFAPNGAPILAGSAAPPLLVLAVPNNTQPYALPIDRPTPGTVLKLDSIPDYGYLYNSADGTATTTGSPLAAGATITHLSGTLVWVAHSPFSTDMFNITVNGAVSVVHIRCSDPPIVETKLSYTIPANSMQSLVPLGKDPIGLTWRRKVTSFPAFGDLLNMDYDTAEPTTVITPENPYLTHPGGFISYSASLNPGITNFSIVFENEVGLSSEPTLVNLVVSPTNYLPVTVDEEYVMSQGGSLWINLSYTDDNDDLATIAITSLPKYGTLYHIFPNKSRGEEITESFNPFSAGIPESEWATRVIGISSYFGESSDYHPNQTLGKPNVFAYGDSVRANSFRTRTGLTNGQVIVGGTPPLNYTYDPETWYNNFGYTEYIEWEFGSTPLYAIEFLVNMCRGPGSVVSIKSWSPRQRWETLYSGKADASVVAQRKYWSFRPTICRTNYATNKLRVEYDTRTIGDWAETDAVQYTGTQQRMSAVLYHDELFDVENRVYRVLYIPGPKFSGNDSFSFQANDCPFDRFHTRGDSWIRINVTATPQPPDVAARNIPVTLGENQEIKLLASPGRAGDEITGYTIVQLPKYGKLKVGGVTVDHVPYNISNRGELTYVSNMYIWNEESHDYFNYTASSASNTSEVAGITIPLIPAPAENPVLAWMAVFAIVVMCTLSYVLLFARQAHYPLRTLSLTLNLLVTTATAFTVNIPLHIIMFTGGYSCGFYYWSYMLFPPFFCLAVICAIYRQRHMFRLERVKKKLSREGNHEDDLEYLRYLKAATSEQRMAIFSGIGILIFIVVAAALSEVADSTVGNYYCYNAPVILYSLLVFWLIGCAGIGAGLYYIRRDFEFTGFRRNVFYLLTYGLSLGILYILLITVVERSDQWHSFALLICLIPLAYQFMAVLRPCFLTFAFLRKTASEEEGLEPLSEIIITQKGFAWFLEFCMVEFSQESPLCWRAIQNFKVKTSYAAMKDIYSKYFAPNAPLAVNLSSRSMKDMQMTCPSKNEDTPLQELQSIFNLVQVELLHLMQEDSYLRFVASSYYRRFKKGERVPRREHTHTPSTDSGASGTPHGPGSSGSKGSKGGSKTAPKDQRSVESQGGKEDSKGTAIDPLTGGWAYESGEETTDTSARPASSAGLSNSRHLGLVDLETVRESVDEASPSAGPRSPSTAEVVHEDGPAIEMSTRQTLTAEEHGLRETLIFNSNPLSKRPE